MMLTVCYNQTIRRLYMSSETYSKHPEKENTVAVGSFTNKTRWRLLVLLTGIIAGCLIMVGGFFFIHSISKNTKKTISPAETVSTPEKAEFIAEKGQYKEAQSLLDGTLKPSMSSTARAEVYISKANLAANNEKYADAQQFAQKAEDIEHSVRTARLLAHLAELQGNKEKAIAYNQTALSRYTDAEKKTDAGAAAFAEIQDDIRELRQ